MGVIDEAQQAAELAQQRAGVTIRSLEDPSDQALAVQVFDRVWPPESGASHVKSNLLRAIIYSGGYCSAAFEGETPIGAALAIVGRHQVATGPSSNAQPWHTHLHSHMAGVLGDHRNRSIGTAIKLHQRAWALEQGIDTIVWSFDPLVRRNARLNLHKLGTDVRGYEPNFYGNMDDAINAGDPSDRVFAWWFLTSERSSAAAREPLPFVDVASLSGTDVRIVETPEDIIAVRATDPSRALEWRLTVREQLMNAFSDGFAVFGLDEDGSYVLTKESRQ